MSAVPARRAAFSPQPGARIRTGAGPTRPTRGASAASAARPGPISTRSAWTWARPSSWRAVSSPGLVTTSVTAAMAWRARRAFGGGRRGLPGHRVAAVRQKVGDRVRTGGVGARWVKVTGDRGAGLQQRDHDPAEHDHGRERQRNPPPAPQVPGCRRDRPLAAGTGAPGTPGRGAGGGRIGDGKRGRGGRGGRVAMVMTPGPMRSSRQPGSRPPASRPPRRGARPASRRRARAPAGSPPRSRLAARI